MNNSVTLDSRLHLTAANVVVGQSLVNQALLPISDLAPAKRIKLLEKATRHLQVAHRALDDLICEVDGIRLDLVAEEQGR